MEPLPCGTPRPKRPWLLALPCVSPSRFSARSRALVADFYEGHTIVGSYSPTRAVRIRFTLLQRILPEWLLYRRFAGLADACHLLVMSAMAGQDVDLGAVPDRMVPGGLEVEPIREYEAPAIGRSDGD